MKVSIALCVACLLGVSSASAQVFHPHHVSRGDHGGHGWRHHDYGHRRSWVGVSYGYGPAYWWPSYSYRAVYGYPYSYYPAYGAGYYGYGPSYSVSSTGGGSRAAGGALLGGIAGAIIGNNWGGGRHNGWNGAAIGAGAGLLLGAIADSAAEERAAERPVVYTQPPASEYNTSQADAQPQASTNSNPQNVTIINNYYGTTPMSSANKMFGR